MSGCDYCGAKFLAALHHSEDQWPSLLFAQAQLESLQFTATLPLLLEGEAFLDRKSHHIAPAYPQTRSLFFVYISLS